MGGCGERKTWKATSMLPPAWLMVFLTFWVGLSLYESRNRHYKNWGATKDYCLLSKVNTLNSQDKPAGTNLPQGLAPRFPRDWLKMYISHKNPHYVGWTICSKVLGISTSTRVTHPSTIQLRWLNLGVPMGSGLRPWIEATLEVMES